LGLVWVEFGSEFRKKFVYGLVLVFAKIFQFGSALLPENHFAKILQHFYEIFFKFLRKYENSV
jgi:hypothetical protein